mgnify:CR=1 FL=1
MTVLKKLLLLCPAITALLTGLAHAETKTTPAATPAPVAVAKGGLRYTIGVTKFENHSNFSGQFALADTLASLLTDSLQRSNHFIVLGEGEMRAAALAEQDLSTAGRTASGGKEPAKGNLTPAQLLVKGDVTSFQPSTKGGTGGATIGGLHLGVTKDTAEINMVIYVIDATTGQVVASQKTVGQAKSTSTSLAFTDKNYGTDLTSFKNTNMGKAVEKAIDDAVTFITAQIPKLHWSGAVILLKDSQVYINRGEREGVTVGQEFKVGASEVLRDPATGETLEVLFTQKGTIKVETVREKISIGAIVTGEGLAPGMSIAPL